MTAQTADRKVPKLGDVNTVFPVLLAFPVEANTSIFEGALVAINAAGNAIPASQATPLEKIVGVCNRQALNLAIGGTTSPEAGIATGVAGSIKVTVLQGAWYFNANTDGGNFTLGTFGANVFASDDNTVSLSDGGGTRPYAGYVLDPTALMLAVTTGGTVSGPGIMVATANPYAANPELPSGSTSAFKARAVITSLAAYTGSGTGVLTETANGAWPAQDGVTNAVGDIVLIQGGTTNLTAALDSGPWQITNLGSAGSKWVLTRPDWFSHGSTIPIAAVVEVGGEGTLFKGTSWKSFAATSANVVDTNDPTFYVGRVTQQITLVASAATVSNVGLLSATKTGIEYDYTGTGAIAATVSYGQTAAITPGYIGTGSVPIAAMASGMTKNGTTDVSVLNVTVINW